jgi:hypothetical protein
MSVEVAGISLPVAAWPGIECLKATHPRRALLFSLDRRTPTNLVIGDCLGRDS